MSFAPLPNDDLVAYCLAANHETDASSANVTALIEWCVCFCDGLDKCA
jgi:hypothetical protein